MLESTKLTVVAVAVLGLAACGGGGGGAGSGGPGSLGSHTRANHTAEDPRDRWNDPSGLRAALRLSPVTDPTSHATAIRALHRASGDTTIGTRTLLDRVAPEDIEILGERNGIIYGQWKGGSAGTLNIEFDWRFAPNVDAQSRALMERAGKVWSRRLTDEFGTHTVPAGISISIDGVERTLDQAVTTDGIVIFVLDKGPRTDNVSSAGPESFVNADDARSRAGKILLNRKHHDVRGIMVHEIGHVLGIGGTRYHPAVARYIDTDNHAFTGPAAMRANGGKPVPYQWIDADDRPVPPGTPGAEVDYSHIAVCTSVMAYCRDRNVVTEPAELDFAILDDVGYDILDEMTASQPELYGYGAWARYAAWGAGVERILDPGTDRLRAGAHAFGVEPATVLADNQALSGSAIWTGSLLGVDIGDAALPPVFGDARLQIELATLSGSARFDNLTVSLHGGATGAFRSPSLEYEGTVAGNVFSDEQRRVSAGFFGPAQEEMAGIVNDPEAGLLAGFGGKR